MKDNVTLITNRSARQIPGGTASTAASLVRTLSLLCGRHLNSGVVRWSELYQQVQHKVGTAAEADWFAAHYTVWGMENSSVRLYQMAGMSDLAVAFAVLGARLDLKLSDAVAGSLINAGRIADAGIVVSRELAALGVES